MDEGEGSKRADPRGARTTHWGRLADNAQQSVTKRRPRSESLRHVRCVWHTELHTLGLLDVDAGLRIVTSGARAPTSASSDLLTGCAQSVRMHLHKARGWRKRCARQGRRCMLV